MILLLLLNEPILVLIDLYVGDIDLIVVIDECSCSLGNFDIIEACFRFDCFVVFDFLFRLLDLARLTDFFLFLN